MLPNDALASSDIPMKSPVVYVLHGIQLIYTNLSNLDPVSIYLQCFLTPDIVLTIHCITALENNRLSFTPLTIKYMIAIYKTLL